MKVAASLVLVSLCRASWVQDEDLRERTNLKVGAAPVKVVLDLDLAPIDRWAFLGRDSNFANFKEDFLSYVGKFFPQKDISYVAKIVAHLRTSFPAEYADEMLGLANALGLDIGDIVLANLIYQVEGLEVKCSQHNSTGPCPPKELNAPGLCTGIVASDGEKMWQGRGLDWNLDQKLLKYVMQVEYRKNNRTLFVAGQVAGTVGVLHGMTQDQGFSGQINARQHGGKLLPNFWELIFAGAATPSMALRRALETSANFEAAVEYLADVHLVNPVYYVVAGTQPDQGAIISRDRKKLVDEWRVNQAPEKDINKVNIQPDWFRLQTNFDHWMAVPSYDDRRNPGVANMEQDCKGNVGADCLWKVMSTWPTKNFHTDVTAIMSAKTGFFDMKVWMQPETTSISV